MEKIKLVFPEIEKTELDFNGQRFFVNKYASPADKCLIANYAIQISEAQIELDLDLIQSLKRDLKFEYGFIGGVLEVMTNINVESLDIDTIVSTGLWAKIRSAILNYHDLISYVEKIENSRIQENNLENKLNKLIDNIGLFIENISKMDFSSENLKTMIEQIGIGKEQLAEVFPIVKDAPIETVKKTRKSKKSTKET
jgi:hypothetical protein